MPGLITALTGGAGLYLYGAGGSPSKGEFAEAPTVARTTMAYVPPPPSGRKPSKAPAALAPSVAVMRGSSPEIEAAMEPNGAWDPLMALRTPDVLKKLQS